MKNTMSRTTIILAASLFAAAPSVAMAEVGATPGNTSITTYNGPPPGGQWPFAVSVISHGLMAGVGSGNGAAGVTAGTLSSSGEQHTINVGTHAPGEICALVPGTDIPLDCGK